MHYIWAETKRKCAVKIKLPRKIPKKIEILLALIIAVHVAVVAATVKHAILKNNGKLLSKIRAADVFH